MIEQWVELLYFDGVGIQNDYGTIEGSIEEAILNKAEHEWVRLNNVRHLDETGTKMESLKMTLSEQKITFTCARGALFVSR